MFGGHVEPGFGPVADAFRENLARRGELGAAVSVWVDGRHVVDLHGGFADRARTRPWGPDTTQLLFSATKGVVATAFLQLASRGIADLDAPLTDWWPTLQAAADHGITVRTLLNHRAGLAALDRPVSLDDLEAWSRGEPDGAVLQALEAQRPLWEPGTAQGYHGVTYGLYTQELFRRITGESLGSWVRREIAGPLGADLHLGLPASEQARVSELVPNGPSSLFREILPRVVGSRSVEGRIYRRFLNRASPVRRAFANPRELGPRGVQNFGTARVRAMELPWASAVGSARGLARVYQGLVSGELVPVGDLAPVRTAQTWAWDRVLCKPMGFSQGWVKDELHLYSPSPDAFGHPGAGGALGFADPANGIAFGYVMNRMDFRLRSPRSLALARAVYASLGHRS